MKKINLSKTSVLIGTTILASVVFGFITLAKAEGGVIRACVKSKGSVYILSEGNSCSPKEKLLTWNIQGPQGLQGEKGDKGDKGDQGVQGPQGPKGDTGGLHMTDTNGVYLGIPLGELDDSAYPNQEAIRLLIPSLNRWIPINAASGRYAFQGTQAVNSIYFSTENCQGQAYAASQDGLLGTQTVDKVINTGALDHSQPQNDRFFIIGDAITGPDPIFLFSRLHNAGCMNTGGTLLHAATATEINLPFSLPVATPMRLRVN